MYNPFGQILDAMRNPEQTMLDMARENMRRDNPGMYQKAMEMTQGKSESQLRETAMNLAKEKGVDLQKFAQQFGIKL